MPSHKILYVKGNVFTNLLQ